MRSGNIACRECGEEFIPQPGKPGFINECPRCLSERATYRDPLSGIREKVAESYRKRCEKLGLDGEARDEWLKQQARDWKDLDYF